MKWIGHANYAYGVAKRAATRKSKAGKVTTITAEFKRFRDIQRKQHEAIRIECNKFRGIHRV